MSQIKLPATAIFSRLFLGRLVSFDRGMALSSIFFGALAIAAYGQMEKDEEEKAALIVRKKEIGAREYKEMLEKKDRVKKVQAWHSEHTAYLRTQNSYATDMNDTILSKVRGNKRANMDGTRDERIMMERTTTLEKNRSKPRRVREGEPATGFKTTRFGKK